MKNSLFFLLFLCFHFCSICQLRIAFGSCGKPERGLPILDTCLNFQPQYFIFLGDNVYADTEDEDNLVEAYKDLLQNQSYQRLSTMSTVLATWDDHDYGLNDSGRHLESKEISKRIFTSTFQLPKTSEIYKHPGIFSMYFIEQNEKRVQIILLDSRTFRDDLIKNPSKKIVDSLGYPSEYIPYQNSDSTLLGEIQWKWLDSVLGLPADYRILGSSIQFAHAYNSYESWNNFPKEKEKLYQLFQKNKVTNLSIISGDVHIGEFSIDPNFKEFPLYDFTSSGLTSKWETAIPNRNRIGEVVMKNHFGLLEFDWEKNILVSKIITIDGKTALQLEIPLSSE